MQNVQKVSKSLERDGARPPTGQGQRSTSFAAANIPSLTDYRRFDDMSPARTRASEMWDENVYPSRPGTASQRQLGKNEPQPPQRLHARYQSPMSDRQEVQLLDFHTTLDTSPESSSSQRFQSPSNASLREASRFQPHTPQPQSSTLRQSWRFESPPPDRPSTTSGSSAGQSAPKQPPSRSRQDAQYIQQPMEAPSRQHNGVSSHQQLRISSSSFDEPAPSFHVSEITVQSVASDSIRSTSLQRARHSESDSYHTIKTAPEGVHEAATARNATAISDAATEKTSMYAMAPRDAPERATNHALPTQAKGTTTPVGVAAISGTEPARERELGSVQKSSQTGTVGDSRACSDSFEPRPHLPSSATPAASSSVNMFNLDAASVRRSLSASRARPGSDVSSDRFSSVETLRKSLDPTFESRLKLSLAQSRVSVDLARDWAPVSSPASAPTRASASVETSPESNPSSSSSGEVPRAAVNGVPSAQAATRPSSDSLREISAAGTTASSTSAPLVRGSYDSAQDREKVASAAQAIRASIEASQEARIQTSAPRTSAGLPGSWSASSSVSKSSVKRSLTAGVDAIRWGEGSSKRDPAQTHTDAAQVSVHIACMCMFCGLCICMYTYTFGCMCESFPASVAAAGCLWHSMYCLVCALLKLGCYQCYAWVCECTYACAILFAFMFYLFLFLHGCKF